MEHIEQSKRLEVQGQPIQSNELFLIRCDQTGKLLRNDLIVYFNDFGHEYEIFCNDCLPFGRNKKRLPFDLHENKVSETQCNRIEKPENI